MAQPRSEAWTIPLQVFMWTVIVCGFMGALVVLFLNAGSK
jgi:hypothetical protein